jgi:hypothetical protein
VVQQAEQEDRVELAQFAQVVGGEHPTAEVAPRAVVPAGISHIQLRGIETHVLDLRKPVHVVSRPAAHVEDPLAGF